MKLIHRLFFTYLVVYFWVVILSIVTYPSLPETPPLIHSFLAFGLYALVTGFAGVMIFGIWAE